MRGILLFFLLLCAAATLNAQSDEDFFILGTFSDYCGRYYIDTCAFEVDQYHPHEKALARYVCRSVVRRYGGLGVTLEYEDQRYRLASPRQFRVIDSLYLASDRLQDDNIFGTRGQALAYLHGVFTRNGKWINDSLCSIRIVNSSQGHLFYKAALSVGFHEIAIEELDNIPHITYVVFRPTQEFAELARTTSRLNAKLVKGEIKTYEKLLGKDIFSREKYFDELQGFESKLTETGPPDN